MKTLNSVKVYSIPHTGTHFVDKLLTDNDVPPDGSVHITDTMEDLGDSLVVVPLRDPMRVAESWAKRYEARGSQLWKQWLPAWRMLPRLADRPNTYFFDLEKQEIDGLSRFLGVDLKTDWKPENSMDFTAKRVIPIRNEMEAQIIYTYITDLQALRDAAELDV